MNKFPEFKELMLQWERETGFHSSPTAWEKHPNFKLLLEFEDVIPFTCLFLKKDPHRAWSIFRAKDKHPPALPAYYAGRVKIYQEAYIYWAINEGYLLSKYDPNKYWLEDKYGNVFL